MEAASAPIHTFLQFLLISATHNILSKTMAAFLITNVLKKFSSKRGMNPTTMTTINPKTNNISVCKTVMPSYCHIYTGSGTVHLLISKELVGKY